MSVLRRLAVTAAAFSVLSTPALAAPIYDFGNASVGGVVTDLGSSEVLAGGITAYAYYYDGDSWESSTLIARDEANDHGLGVCSEGTGNCSIGGTGDGDDNELSQLTSTEAILLVRPDGTEWTELWLSSLDNNNGSTTQGLENGILYWGDTSVVADLISGGGTYAFTYPAFGGTSVEGMLTLPGGFDAGAKYLLFLPGGATGANNDYLVWGANLRSTELDVPVPEPASLVLLGSGLCLLARRRRARR